MNNLATVFLLQLGVLTLARGVDPSSWTMWLALEQNLLSLSVAIVGLGLKIVAIMKMLE